jgi:hypothetical protein
MRVKDLQEKLSKADPEAVVCIYDMFQLPPHQFFQVDVAETVGHQPYTTNSQEYENGDVFMLH